MRSHQELNRLVTFQYFMIIFLLGATMNMAVLVNNDLKMPVYFSSENNNKLVIDDRHVAFNNFDEVNYAYLSDIIGIDTFFKISIGDILMLGAMVFLIFFLIKGKWRKEE